MTIFDQREQAYEAKFAHDEELRFKAVARRDKWLGLWAAEMLGKTGVEAEAYASALVAAGIANHGENNVFLKLRGDFDRAGVTRSDHQIHQQMDELLAKALRDLTAGVGETQNAGPRAD